MCLAARVVGFVLFGAAQLLQVVALDGLVQGELRERVVYGEPLPLAPHQPGVLPLRQLLGHRHHVHFCPVFVLAILECEKNRLVILTVRISADFERGDFVISTRPLFRSKLRRKLSGVFIYHRCY